MTQPNAPELSASLSLDIKQWLEGVEKARKALETISTTSGPTAAIPTDGLAKATQAAVAQTQAATEQMGVTWKQFVAERMGEYMKLEGGHGAAMKRIGAEWQQYKATATTAAKDVQKAASEIPKAIPTVAPKNGDLDKIKALANEINTLRNNFQALPGRATAEQIEALAKAMSDAKARAEAMKVQFALGSKELRALSVATAQAERTIVAASGGMSRLGLASQVQSALLSSGLGKTLSAVTPALGQFSAGIGAATVATSPFNAGIALATTGLSIFSSNTTRASDQLYAMQRALNVLRASGEKDIDSLKARIASLQDAGGKITQSFSKTDLTTAVAAIVKAGRDTSEAFALMGTAAKLAVSENEDLGESAARLNRNLRQFGLGVNDAARAGDALAKAGLAADGRVADLSEGLATVGPVAKAAGLSIEETLGLLVNLDQKGLSAAEEGAVLSSLAKPSKEAQGQIAALGIDLEKFNTLTVRERLFELRDAIIGTGAQLEDLAAIADTRALTALVNLDGSSKTLTKDIQDSKGALEDLANQMADGNENAAIRLKKAQDDLALSFRENLGPSIAGVQEKLAGYLDLIGKVLNPTEKYAQLGAELATKLGARISDQSTLAELGKLQEHLDQLKPKLDDFRKSFETNAATRFLQGITGELARTEKDFKDTQDRVNAIIKEGQRVQALAVAKSGATAAAAAARLAEQNAEALRKQQEYAAKGAIATADAVKDKLKGVNLSLIPDDEERRIAQVKEKYLDLIEEVNKKASENPTFKENQAPKLLADIESAQGRAVQAIRDEFAAERAKKAKAEADKVAAIVKSGEDRVLALKLKAATTPTERARAEYEAQARDLKDKLTSDLEAVKGNAQATLSVRQNYNAALRQLAVNLAAEEAKIAADARKKALADSQALARTIQDQKLDVIGTLAGLTESRVDDEKAAYEKRKVQTARFFKDEIIAAKKAGQDTTELERTRDATIEAQRREHVKNLADIEKETSTEATRKQLEKLTGNLDKLNESGSKSLLGLLTSMRGTAKGNADALALIDKAIISTKARLSDLAKAAKEAREKALQESQQLARAIQDARLDTASVLAGLTEDRRDDEEAAFQARLVNLNRSFKDEIARYKAHGMDVTDLERERDRAIEAARRQHAQALTKIDQDASTEATRKQVEWLTEGVDKLNTEGSKRLLDFLKTAQAANKDNAESFKLLGDAITQVQGRLDDLTAKAREAQEEAARTISGNWRSLARERAELTKDEFDDLRAALADDLAGIDETFAKLLASTEITERQRADLVTQYGEARRLKVEKYERDTAELARRIQTEDLQKRAEALTKGLDDMDAAQAESAAAQLQALLKLAKGNEEASETINAALDSVTRHYVDLRVNASKEIDALITKAADLSRETRKALSLEGASQLATAFAGAGEKIASVTALVAELNAVLTSTDATGEQKRLAQKLITDLQADARGLQAQAIRQGEKIITDATKAYSDGLKKAAQEAAKAALDGVPEALEMILGRVDDLNANALAAAERGLGDLLGALINTGLPEEALTELRQRYAQVRELQDGLAARTQAFLITRLDFARELAAAVLDESAARDVNTRSLREEVRLREQEVARVKATTKDTQALTNATDNLTRSKVKLLEQLIANTNALRNERAALAATLDTTASVAGLVGEEVPDSVIEGYKALAESYLALGNAALVKGNIAEANDLLAKGTENASKYADAIDARLVKSYDKLFKSLKKNPRSFDGAAVMEFAKQLAAEFEITVPEAYDLVLHNVKKGIDALDPTNLVRRAVQGVTDASEDALEAGEKIQRRAVAGATDALALLNKEAGKTPEKLKTLDERIADLTRQSEELKATITEAADFKTLGQNLLTGITGGIAEAEPRLLEFFRALTPKLLAAFSEKLGGFSGKVQDEFDKAVGKGAGSDLKAMLDGAAKAAANDLAAVKLLENTLSKSAKNFKAEITEGIKSGFTDGVKAAISEWQANPPKVTAPAVTAPTVTVPAQTTSSTTVITNRYEITINDQQVAGDPDLERLLDRLKDKAQGRYRATGGR
jgi:hypothetical protein